MKISTVERARKEGYRLGLRTVHEILRKAHNYQAQKAKKTNGADDSDVKAELEHGVNILHDMCLRVQDEIKKASV